jgi:copper chaperone CopZ
MEKAQFNVPRLWADHHTLKVRAALMQVAGVQEVIASSAFRMVMVTYDPALTSSPALSAVLNTAGYPVAVSGEEVVEQPVPVADGRKDPAWDRLGFRVARTDSRDVKK